MFPTFSFDLRLLKQREPQNIVGANDALVVATQTLAADELGIIFACSLASSDAVSRQAHISIGEPGTLGAAVAAFRQGAVISGVQLAAENTPIIVPPGCFVQGNVVALTLGTHIELRLIWLRLKLPHPANLIDEIWTIPKPV